MFVILTNIPTPYRTHFFNELSGEVKKSGEDFHVLYCSITEPNRNWKFVPDENRYDYEILKGIHPNFKGIYPHINLGVIPSLRRLKPTKVLLAGSWNTPTMILALLYLRFKHIKTVFWSEAHNDSVKKTKGSIANARQIIFSLFDAFAVPNERSKNYILNTLKIRDKPIFLLPNTVNDKFFLAKAVPAKLNRFDAFKNKKIIVQVSQLEDRKGVMELIEAWLSINKAEKKDWVVAIAGDGPLYGRLNETIRSNESEDIILTGQLDTSQIRELLQLSSIFILATKNDPNPLSVIEAAFSGLPLIVSSVAGNSTDLVISGINGYLLNEISKSEIRQKISEIIKLDDEKLKEMGLKSKQIALEKFQSKVVAASLIEQINADQ